MTRRQKKADGNCRMGMDGTTRPVTSLDPVTSSIMLRRLHPWIASYTDVVVFLLKCNMDIKFIGSGEAAKAFLYYVTDYITKPALPVHAGLAALSYAISQAHVKIPELQPAPTASQALSAVTISVNSMMGHQEISHPQVMSYLVGGGDHYTSDTFQVAQWGSIRRYVEKELGVERDYTLSVEEKEPSVDLRLGDQKITVSNIQLDYCYRSTDPAFNNLCLYDFIALVRKVRKQFDKESTCREEIWAGCLSSWDHPQRGTHYQSKRKQPVIPVLLGPRFARPDRTEEEREIWARDILLLFKPWRCPQELRDPNESWASAYENYETLISRKNRKVIANMNVLTECREARDDHARKRQEGDGDGSKAAGERVDTLVDNMIQDFVPIDNGKGDSVYGAFDTVDGIIVNGELAVQARNVVGQGTSDLLDLCLPPSVVCTSPPLAGLATILGREDDALFANHTAFMANQKKRRRPEQEEDDMPSRRRRVDEPAVTVQSMNDEAGSGIITFTEVPKEHWEVVEEVIDEMGLRSNAEQLRAFNVVARHILTGQDQLLMYVAGVGGTGKSHVIRSLVMLFERLGRRSELLIGAPTGIAAVLVGGFTLHSLILATPNKKSNDVVGLSTLWKGVKYLIVDEISMVGARFLSQMSSRLRMAKGEDIVMRAKPFGGVNVLFTGDFGQLKPPKQYSLYAHELIKNPSFAESRNEAGINAMNGIILWRQVQTVVKLTQNQRHASDSQYAEFLARLREGRCIQRSGIGSCDDLDYIKSRLLVNLRDKPVELAEFWDAPFVVGSKVLRDSLNVKLIAYHSSRLDRAVYLYHSVDRIKKAVPPEGMRELLWNMSTSESRETVGRLPLFVGMRVMITENIAFGYGVVNGAEGVVHEIKYDVDEKGRRFAKVVYVRIAGCGIKVDGFDRDIVPIFPVSVRIEFQASRGEDMVKKAFVRMQLPLIPAYAYTDFKSQGRTLPRVIVDLVTAKGQGVYVMLSRVKTLRGLVILRWFPPTKIFQRLPEELRAELSRIDDLSENTRVRVPCTGGSGVGVL